MAHAFGPPSHRICLFQTIRGPFQRQSWVSQPVDNVDLDAYTEEDAVVGGIVIALLYLITR